MKAFHELHRRRYGFADEARPVEIVNVRVRMVAASELYEPERRAVAAGDGRAALSAERDVWFEGGWRPTRIYKRELLQPGDSIAGPAMITEYTAATLVLPGCDGARGWAGKFGDRDWGGIVAHITQRIPSGAKARTVARRFSARLKSCPFKATKFLARRLAHEDAGGRSGGARDFSERGAFDCGGDGRGAAKDCAIAKHQGATRLFLRGV